MPYGHIYVITNKSNGKLYVGQTTFTPEQRWKQHVEDSGHKQYLINRAIRKYGKDGFEVEGLATAENQEMLDKYEELIIACLNSTKRRFGYNLQLGGRGGRHSLASRRKMSRSQKERLKTHKPNLLGFKHSEESKAKMRAAHLGMKNKKYPKNRKRISEESRQILSVAIKQAWDRRKAAHVS